jgi:hypothetical protein
MDMDLMNPWSANYLEPQFIEQHLAEAAYDFAHYVDRPRSDHHADADTRRKQMAYTIGSFLAREAGRFAYAREPELLVDIRKVIVEGLTLMIELEQEKWQVSR